MKKETKSVVEVIEYAKEERKPEEHCAVAEYFKQHPDQKAAYIACFCSKCSPKMETRFF